MRKTTLTAAAAFVAVLAFTGCSGASTPPVNTPTAEASPTATPSPTPTPEATVGSREAPLAIGETRQLSDGSAWIVGLTGANYDAFESIRAADQYQEAPPEEHRLVVGTVLIGINGENLEAQGLDITADGVQPWYSLDITYVGADGKGYSSITSDSYCATANDLFGQSPAYDASVVTVGDVCFPVPEAAIPGGLWRISNTNNDAVWVQGSEG